MPSLNNLGCSIWPWSAVIPSFIHVWEADKMKGYIFFRVMQEKSIPTQREDREKDKNIQQRVFAGRHRPNY